jgi:alkylation response protein AidB-like acyl-CoA dehydrogenase
MQVVFTEDQAQFKRVVHRFFDTHSTTTAVRGLSETETGFDPLVWAQLSETLGLSGTHLSEEYGGHGFGPVELGIILEEMGRTLYCGPFFSSAVMAGYALERFADEAAKIERLPQIADGSIRATLVLDDLNHPSQVGRLIQANEAGALTGSAPIVLDGCTAEDFIIVARNGAGLGLYALPRLSEGVTAVAQESIDMTRKVARVTLQSAKATKIGDVTSQDLNRFWDLTSVALAHEMIGGAARLLEETVEYTKGRYQFGRPIGSFQALKHRCADLLMSLEFAKAATHYAGFCLAASDAETIYPSMAKAMAADCFMEMARAAIQLRGGIGFTWENDTHLWFKRAKCDEVLLGAPHRHRARMIDILQEAKDVA